MLPASGMEAKCKSPPPPVYRRLQARRLRIEDPVPEDSEKHDTHRLATIARHNDGSMGKFSYNG